MPKILNATCVGGVVKYGALPVQDVAIFSEGVGESAGLLILDKDLKAYMPKTTPDLKTTIEKISSSLDELSGVLTQIATTLTSIGAGMTGPTTAPPPTLAADVVQINLSGANLTAIKAELDTLKAGLK